jgi:hypothetical protein
MYTLKTKESRLTSLQIQFENLLKNGYAQEVYKDLNIFTQDNEKGFLLKIFKGTSTNSINYTNYRTESRRTEAIEQSKKSFDYWENYKAELKANPTKSSAANCAAAIREELKKEFPGIKFYVKSDNFAGGNSVDIRWADGPTTSEVENFTSKYQYGHFNGMEDIYENTNNRNDIPQAKYVSESREMSEETRNILFPIAEQLHAQNDYGCHDAQNFLYRIFQKSSIPANATVTGIERNEETCGLCCPSIFFVITYTLPLQTIEAKQTPIETKTGEVSVIEYSEKAIAVIGDTYPIKEKLKEAGGKFNKFLSCGAGWIFPKTKLTELQTLLNA